ncbi:MAG: hypothetical protein AAFP02_18285 [Bacteroidota bacterium]
MQKPSHSLWWGLLAAILIACGSTDLSLINRVKRFEPEWTNLAEKVSYVDRNLRATQRHYLEDLEAVDPYLTNARLMQNARLPSVRSQFLNIISERDSIQQEFDAQKASFLYELNAFNDWKVELMNGDLNEQEARQQLESYQRGLGVMMKKMDGLQDRTIRNIEEHNSILRQVSSRLDLYQNFDINPR